MRDEQKEKGRLGVDEVVTEERACRERVEGMVDKVGEGIKKMKSSSVE